MISEDEVKKAIQALWNQESHYQTKQGKVLVFDDESLKVAQSLKIFELNFQTEKSRCTNLVPLAFLKPSKTMNMSIFLVISKDGL